MSSSCSCRPTRCVSTEFSETKAHDSQHSIAFAKNKCFSLVYPILNHLRILFANQQMSRITCFKRDFFCLKNCTRVVFFLTNFNSDNVCQVTDMLCDTLQMDCWLQLFDNKIQPFSRIPCWLQNQATGYVTSANIYITWFLRE